MSGDYEGDLTPDDAGGPVAAYLILNYDVREPDALAAYRAAATPVLIGPDRGRLLASTADTEHLPEAPALGTHTVVLHFGSLADARSSYWSEDYQELLPQRLTAVTPRAALLVGASASAPVEVDR